MSSCKRPDATADHRGGTQAALRDLGRQEQLPEHEELAPCAQVATGDGVDLWFPTSGCDEFTSIAKRICATCPFQADCLQIALTNKIPYGIWGGKTATERRQLTASK